MRMNALAVGNLRQTLSARRLGWLPFAALSFVLGISATHAEEPIYFRHSDITPAERAVIETLLMREPPEDPINWVSGDIEWLRLVMDEEHLSMAEAKDWIVQYSSFVAYGDVTGDGKDEFLVHFEAGYLCGNSACPTFVLEKSGPDWVQLTDIPASFTIRGPNSICVSDKPVNGRPYFYSWYGARFWTGQEYQWSCVNDCEGILPGSDKFGREVAKDLSCLRGTP